MIYLVIGGIIIFLIQDYIIYRLAKTNGEKGMESERYKKIALDTARNIQDFQTQINRWDNWRAEVNSHIKAVNIALIPDAGLTQLYKDPTNFDLSTNPEKLVPSIGSGGKEGSKE